MCWHREIYACRGFGGTGACGVGEDVQRTDKFVVAAVGHRHVECGANATGETFIGGDIGCEHCGHEGECGLCCLHDIRAHAFIGTRTPCVAVVGAVEGVDGGFAYGEGIVDKQACRVYIEAAIGLHAV